jgi:hypothetical protein
MSNKILAFGVLVLLLAALAAGFSASASGASRVTGLSLEIPSWQQANSNGFGDPQAGEVSAVEAFNGYLYAGTHNPSDPAKLFDGAQILRSAGGTAWTPVTQPGFGSSHDTRPPAILDLTIFKGYLYASTGRGNAAQIWRSADGVNWGRVVNAGFGDPDIVELSMMTEYSGWLYVGASKQDSEAQIWRTSTGDGNLSSWTQVAIGADPASVTGLVAFDSALYAAVQSETDAPAQIWRSYGGTWTTIISDGFGDSNTTLTGGMAVFGGYLYVGAGNTVNGAQLWRSNDGENWSQAITPAFGDASNLKVEMVSVFLNKLYVSVKNAATGIEIWRSADGTTWEQVNLDGFGDKNNTSSNFSNASADFLGQLYVGTSNVVDGGELWRKQPEGNIPGEFKSYLPLIFH